MAQVTLCNHCGEQIDEGSEPFARAQFNVSTGGAGQLDFHNSSQKPCFDAAYEAVKDVSAFPERYPDLAAKAAE